MSNSDADQAKTRAAVYILLLKNNKTPMILRSNTGYRDGEWALPSGKVDHNEPFTVAAIREAKEEIGVKIQAKDLDYVLTLHRKSDNNPNEAWVDMLFVCKEWSGEPYNAEPEKHSELQWFALDNLPDTLMDYQRAIINGYVHNENYIEFGWKQGDYK